LVNEGSYVAIARPSTLKELTKMESFNPNRSWKPVLERVGRDLDCECLEE